MADNGFQGFCRNAWGGIRDSANEGAKIGEAAALVNSMQPGGIPANIGVPVGKFAGAAVAGGYVGPFYSAGRMMGLWK